MSQEDRKNTFPLVLLKPFLKEDVFSCSSFEFAMDDISEHGDFVIIHPPNVNLFNCEYEHCGYKTERKYKLSQHTKKVHLKIFQCDECPFKESRKKELRIHQIVKHNAEPNEKDEIHKCDKCDYKSFRKECLRDHIKNNHSEREKTFKCTLCEKMFYCNGDKAKHIKIVHKKIKSYECEECSARFSKKTNLNNHKISAHKEIKDVRCSICSKMFKSDRYLQYHTNNTHGTKNRRPCEICGKNLIDLRRHMKLVHGNKQFRCEICNYETAELRKFNSHTKVVHENIKEFACQECPREYGRKSVLKKHMQRVHSTSNDVEPITTCEICGFEGKNLKSLQGHFGKMHKEKQIQQKYPCKFCQRGFKYPSLLEKHMISQHKDSVM